MGMGGNRKIGDGENGNGNDSMGVGRNGNKRVIPAHVYNIVGDVNGAQSTTRRIATDKRRSVIDV